MFNEYGITEDDLRSGIVFLEHSVKPHPLVPAHLELPWVQLCLVREKERFERISTGQTYPPEGIRYVFPRFPKGRFLPDSEYFYRKHSRTKQELAQADDHKNAWFSYHLQVFHEPPLYNMPTNKEIFRWLCVPSFSRPSLVRIEKDGEHCSLTWKICDERVRYGIEKIVGQQSQEMSKYLWNIFQAKLGRISIWNPRRKTLCFDGVSFLFEGRTSDVYLMKYEHSPEKGPFADLCLFFRKLCGCQDFHGVD